MDTLFSLVLWSLIAAGISADQWFGIEWAGNISIFIIWTFSLFSILAVFLPKPKDEDKKNVMKSKHVIRVAYFCSLILMIAAGWFVTAIFSFFSWILLFAKRISDKEDNERLQS